MENLNLTPVQLNCLISRYLTESGFEISANVFEEQIGIDNHIIDETLVPPGALVEIVRKGVEYSRVVATCDDSDSEADDCPILRPIDFITKDISELQRIIKEEKEKLQKEKEKKGKGKAKKFDQENEQEEGQEIEEESERNIERMEKDQKRKKKKKKKKKQHNDFIDTVLSKDLEDKVDVEHEEMVKKFDQEHEREKGQEIEEPSERNKEWIERDQKRKKKKKKKKQHNDSIDTALSKDHEDKVDVEHEDSGV